ncbi:MAG: hypothetical protein QOF76_1724 [Solirubrobacteraceae bacterium]|jgi:hypothetical protein|nr:hypothetical protein [Solirubrobacteraceae bacterium]
MTDITIRSARPADVDALLRLAALDSQALPTGDLVVAEVGGELVAAYEPASARAVADPFVHSAGAVELLRLRATEDKRRAERHRNRVIHLPRLA